MVRDNRVVDVSAKEGKPVMAMAMAMEEQTSRRESFPEP